MKSSIAVLLALLALLVTKVAAAQGKESLLHAHCPGKSGEYAGTMKARVVLNRAFFDPAVSDEESIRAGIEQQLKYLWGFHHNDPAAKRALQVVFSSEPPELTVLSRREVPYGRDLELPWKTNDPLLKIEDPYTTRAITRGFTRVSDPALVVEYHVKWKLALCGRGKSPGRALAGPLPPDPWLAQWYVPEKLYRPLDYFGARAVVNPCADDDYASLPHPIYYWYDWLPTRHGPDADGHAFDCRKLLSPQKDYDWFTATLAPAGASVDGFARLRSDLLRAGARGPLKATFVFGVIDHTVSEPVLAPWRDLIGDGSSHDLLRARVTEARRAWSKEPKRERGTGLLLLTLDELVRFVEIERFTSTVDDGYLTTVLFGRLTKSGVALELRMILGLTDILGPKPPAHWRHLHRAVTQDHLVVYTGHSGVGENFRLAQIEKHLQLDHARFVAELAAAPLRVVAYLSCFSYMYFGRDLLAAAPARKTDSLFVFTGMGPTRRDDGPTAVLELIDRTLAPRNSKARFDRLFHVGDDEFWIIKEVLGSRPTQN